MRKKIAHHSDRELVLQLNNDARLYARFRACKDEKELFALVQEEFEYTPLQYNELVKEWKERE